MSAQVKHMDDYREDAATEDGSLSDILPGILDTTSWRLPTDLPRDEWIRAVNILATMEDGLPWWLGDALVFGEMVYGQTYAQVARETKYKERTLRDFKWVANAIDPQDRHPEVCWSIHREVASLDPDERAWHLRQASERNMTRAEVRQAIRMGGRPDHGRPNAAPETSGTLDEDWTMEAQPPAHQVAVLDDITRHAIEGLVDHMTALDPDVALAIREADAILYDLMVIAVNRWQQWEAVNTTEGQA